MTNAEMEGKGNKSTLTQKSLLKLQELPYEDDFFVVDPDTYVLYKLSILPMKNGQYLSVNLTSLDKNTPLNLPFLVRLLDGRANALAGNNIDLVNNLVPKLALVDKHEVDIKLGRISETTAEQVKKALMSLSSDQLKKLDTVGIRDGEDMHGDSGKKYKVTVEALHEDIIGVTITVDDIASETIILHFRKDRNSFFSKTTYEQAERFKKFLDDVEL
jgi:hypothetical protein